MVSTVTIIGFLLINKILQRFGNFHTSIGLILIQILAFYGLITFSDEKVILPLFIIGMSFINLIGFTIDVFIQKNTDFGHAGTIRGVVMTAINMAWILGPLIGGLLVTGDSYRGVYVAGFALLFPLIYMVYKNFRNFHDAHYIQLSTRETCIRILKNKDISKLFIINIILQTFYAWMTIYTPIYLHNTLNFDWKEISVMFTIMLIPFVLVEYPLGKLADKKWGEKEMLAMGFAIMGIATASLSLFTFKSFVIWTAMLFITRIGAATSEIMIETYFFKKIDGKDPEMLSLFRITRSVSYFVAPLITTISLVYLPETYLFAVLGIICLFMLWPILTIRDTN